MIAVHSASRDIAGSRLTAGRAGLIERGFRVSEVSNHEKISRVSAGPCYTPDD